MMGFEQLTNALKFIGIITFIILCDFPDMSQEPEKIFIQTGDNRLE